jgi:hypothetical protein
VTAAGGPSLVWSWFGPDYILPRHSHSADCLYYVTRGELRMGNNVLQAGDGFFVPSDAPYAYTAGPDGVEILEFRTTSPFDMQITESLPRWDRIVEGVRANRARWASAARDVRDEEPALAVAPCACEAGVCFTTSWSGPTVPSLQASPSNARRSSRS